MTLEQIKYSDPVLYQMILDQIPLSVENYLSNSYPDRPATIESLEGEERAQIPMRMLDGKVYPLPIETKIKQGTQLSQKSEKKQDSQERTEDEKEMARLIGGEHLL